MLISHIWPGMRAKGEGRVTDLSEQPLLPWGNVGFQISILNIVFVC